MGVRESKLPDTMIDLNISDKLKEIEIKEIDKNKIIPQNEDKIESESILGKIKNIFSSKKQ